MNLCGSPVIQLTHLHHTLSILVLSNDNLLCRILPISLLLLLSLPTLPVAHAQGDLHLDGPDPPAPQQCGSYTLTLSGGVPPYFLLIRNATDEDHTVVRMPENGTDNTTLIWSPIDFRGGTGGLFAEVKDSNGNKAFTGSFAVESGDDSECLGQVSAASSTASSTSPVDSAYNTASIPTSSLSNTPTPTNSSSSLPSSQKSAGRLSIGTIVGIAVGLAITVVAAAAVLLCLRRKKADRGVVGLFGRTQNNGGLSSKRPTKTTASARPFILDDGGCGLSAASVDAYSSNKPDISEVCTPTGTSLVARASSIDSHVPDLEQAIHPRRRSNDGPIQSEKLLRELRSRVAPGIAPEMVYDRADDTIEDLVSSVHGIEHDRGQGGRRRETDGGVRLAGGRVREAMVDDLDHGSVSEGSTLPPAYSSHYGEV